MPTISFIEPHGETCEIEAAVGQSVMQAAVAAGLGGIVAECGGNLMCATCHVYVSQDGTPIGEGRSEEEEALLEGAAAEVRESSRLSCQIPVTAELDGAVFEIPDRQI